MLYFISGLKGIDTALYESAEIDGATSIQKFRYITIPLLKPTTIYVVTISVYAGLSMFLESFMLWAGNNSPNNIGLTIVGYLYKRGIEKNQLGYASAVGLVLLIIALIINHNRDDYPNPERKISLCVTTVFIAAANAAPSSA